MMRLVVLDGFATNPGDLSWAPLEQWGEVVVYDRTAPCDVIDRARDAEALIINKVVLGEEQLSQLPNLRYIGVSGTGYNVVDVDAASRRGITVTNVPAYSTDSVAQMVFAHLLNVTNQVAGFGREAREGKWSAAPDFCYWNSPLREVASMTLGIVGFGNIGQKVALIAADFGMKVLVSTSKDAARLPDYVEKSEMETLFGRSDVVSLHCPLATNTRHLVNRESLRGFKKGAILINTGRGPLVDEAAVAEALTTGTLAAYGADVAEQEPPRADNPLLRCQNAFFTPHVAWATVEARQRLIGVVAENVGNFLQGKPCNRVNPIVPNRPLGNNPH